MSAGVVGGGGASNRRANILVGGVEEEETLHSPAAAAAAHISATAKPFPSGSPLRRNRPTQPTPLPRLKQPQQTITHLATSLEHGNRKRRLLLYRQGVARRPQILQAGDVHGLTAPFFLRPTRVFDLETGFSCWLLRAMAFGGPRAASLPLSVSLFFY